MKKIAAILLLVSLQSFATDRHVSVFYYPWYDVSRHWGEGYLRHLLDPAQEPLLGRYSNRDSEVLQQHVQWSQDYGIDNWICSWWGPSSWEDQTIADYIAPELDGSQVTFCLFYESAGLLNMQNGRIEFDAQRTAAFRQHFQYIADQFFDEPAYYKIDGRPVVYIYLTRTFVGAYQAAIDSVRQDMAALGYDIFLIGDEVFWGTPNAERISTLDAITAYNMHGPSEYDGYPADTKFIDKVAVEYRSYQFMAGFSKTAFIPKIMPGFNDRGVRLATNHYVIPNQVHPDSSATSTFEHFAKMAQEFIDPSLNALCITSFNEWHEDTQIEPTVVAPATRLDISDDQRYTKGYAYVGYGTAYLEIIKKYFGPDAARVSTRPRTAAREFVLSSFPNPFNDSTEISFVLPRASKISVLVYDLFGRRVKRIDLGTRNAGRQKATIRMADQASGLYFCIVQGSGFASSLQKLVLVK